MANRNRQRRAVPPDQVATQPQFPVVGSGASAGWFESFKVILENLLITPVLLPVDVAVHCGLILNELVNNAIKYAFPAGQMHGTVELGPGPGTDFHVTFPNPGVTR